jgi:polysaccharide export outer membrane protein
MIFKAALQLPLVLSCAFFGMQGHAFAKSATLDVAPWSEEAPIKAPRLNAKLINPAPLNEIAATEKIIPKKLSPLEDMYSERVVDELQQFGYSLFTQPSVSERTDSLPAGAVQDSFVLSIGDQLSVTIRGQRQLRLTTEISNEGMLIIDEFTPIPAAGRTLGQVRTQLESEVAQLYNTDVFLSLTKVNQVNVLVVGNVNMPGRKTLTGFDTVLDALSAAGGIEKTGTLRQIRLIRDGRTIMIDLYGLLMYGSDNSDLALRNGDKIMVRPLGPTIAVAGGVKRPGIYEILPALQANWESPDTKSQRLSLNDLLDMSGGVLSTAQNRYIRLAMTASGQEQIQDIIDPLSRVFGDGDILMVERGKERREGTVEVMGFANTRGIHALSGSRSLSALLGKERSLQRGTYPLIGLIERWNKNGLTRELIAFPPMLVMQSQYDRALSDGDIVHLFSHSQIAALQKNQGTQSRDDAIAMGDIDPAAGESDEDLLEPLITNFLKERSVFVRGAVRKPGAYPVSAGATLENILAMAGGLSIEANTGNIEISRALPTDIKMDILAPEQRRMQVNLANTDAATVGLGAGDTVRINQKYRRVEDNHVLIVGEIANPGTYDVMPGDTLGALLARSGGLTGQAYPEGTIFSRTSERKREEGRFKAQARDLEMRLASELENSDQEKRPGSREVVAAKDLISQLRQAQALGRITIEANPEILAKKPELDILLESGDRIYIPKRPMTVRVAGEVLSPAALQFRAGVSPADYIIQAGGYTYNADKGRAFVVYPDGSARPLSGARSTGGGSAIPPGSTIVVPRDPKPFDFMDTAKDLTQILANLATTAIFASAIGSDH